MEYSWGTPSRFFRAHSCPASLRGRPSTCSQCLMISCERMPVTATGFDRGDIFNLSRVSARQLRLESAPAEETE